ncbi:MAG: Phosphoribosylformylglycinamidine synthase [Candidatus Moranbacteria bacterium GW2011_GWF2_36_839]|nr:MAG: Phosphoribosylformylglycinamidine synthase [Candidatus Moranbacteria bacterium GW2011_GWF1_36_78]KKQ17014.1 MAG: Phosphoribosylformylglycinamidine synthase [Candidatus Moranbacteria bacterium GW2011_GWF2_36_839]HAT74026.1 phosphoribosylformylglycinamidine synthase [Candidatus Moranbacteria bacterium]HBY11190.1 phosphoribosylformylglycinamidine synthase [Candidatus Moranbacteria bacterium]
MQHFFMPKKEGLEHCFNVETSAPLTIGEIAVLEQLLTEGFVTDKISETLSNNGGQEVVELGPRMNFATFFSTNLVSACHACGLEKITRIERSRRHPLPAEIDKAQFTREHHDRMTECVYQQSLVTFDSGILPEPVTEIPMMENGPDALLKVPGLAMDAWDRNLYYEYFVGEEKRNPTIVEIRDLDNANSEHSRHGYFRGKQIINGVAMPETLMEIVQSTLTKNPGNSIIAFKDNSSGIKGYDCWTIIPENPGAPSPFVKKKVNYHIIFTAETHNFPTGIAPFPGAETGTGGRIRDVQATGRGGLVVAGTAGYCVANLLIPGYDLPWEDKNYVYPSNLAPSLNVEIRASDGASDYGNKFGEPVILGFTRSFDQRLPNGERWGWIKKIMFTGGIGQIDARHIEKGEAEKGMLIVQVGGPAYGIGVGGGSASSKLQGDNDAELDFNAVQRGDAEMEQKMNRVIRACVEMEDKNPIVSVHDQGAGGSANVLKELVEKAGGMIELRRIKLGDPTLSVLKIWIAEYQERCGFLIISSRIEEFKSICEREKVNCEVLGEVTGDGRFLVHDEQDDSTPVNLDLAKVLGNMPQKTFKDERIECKHQPLNLPDMTMEDALYRVLRNLAVGSKRFLVSKVDRSVTGLIAQQQCCGPLQLPVSDVAVIAQSHFGITGAATSIGEQPIKMLVNPKAGGRMAVTEALTNLVWARISGLEDVKCSANWMWAPKLPGEGAALYDAACAMRDAMIQLGIAVDGGKDSLSMATRVGDEIVKSPRELVISAYATMPDITKVVTPDFKSPGASRIIYIDLANGKKRLGGSALAQCYGQLGDECPDMEDPQLLKRAFMAIQELIDKGLILAGHDVSDGGLIVTLLEMAFAGNCGFSISTPTCLTQDWFAEEAGLVIECPWEFEEVTKTLKGWQVPFNYLGFTMPASDKNISIKEVGTGKSLLEADMQVLRQWWEETSYQIERLQKNPECADQEKNNIFERKGPKYNVSFEPKLTPGYVIETTEKPEVAILREEGSNGDREMTSAFYQAGFKPWDITMTDLLSGKIDLERFRGFVAVGGFSYADVPESAKGWAATIRFNEKLNKMFADFYKRPDTFSLGVCNGCQLFALLGWVPWQGLSDEEQPRFIKNLSGRFESRWATVKILESPAIMLQGMENSILGVWVAHGEGRLYSPQRDILPNVIMRSLDPMRFVDDAGNETEVYPFNPNGSPSGITALCSPDGRHLAMMPHPERAFLKWQWPYRTAEIEDLLVSPWIKMFQNAREWCENK